MRRPTPPTLRALLDDPVYRKYMLTVPRSHPMLATADPWRLWVRTPEGKWRTGLFNEYRSVWSMAVNKLRTPETAADVVVESRRVLFAPPGYTDTYEATVRPTRPTVANPGMKPFKETRTRWIQTFTWDRGAWCPRCRRPSFWAPLSPSHHALKNQPCVTDDDNTRCMFCGIRWVAVENENTWTRIEVRP